MNNEVLLIKFVFVQAIFHTHRSENPRDEGGNVLDKGLKLVSLFLLDAVSISIQLENKEFNSI